MTDVKFNLQGLLKIVLEEPEKSAAGCFVTVSCGGLQVTARGDGMAYKLQNGMKIDIKVSYVDKDENPASVDGDVTWASSDEGMVTVEADADDSMQATITTVGEIGQCQVTASADADLGEGVKTLLTTMDVEVVSGEAVAGKIEPVGEAVPIA